MTIISVPRYQVQSRESSSEPWSEFTRMVANKGKTFRIYAQDVMNYPWAEFRVVKIETVETVVPLAEIDIYLSEVCL